MSCCQAPQHSNASILLETFRGPDRCVCDACCEWLLSVRAAHLNERMHYQAMGGSGLTLGGCWVSSKPIVKPMT